MKKNTIIARQQPEQPMPIPDDELLPIEEEVALIKQFQQGGEDSEAAFEKVMRANMRFVYHVAKQYTGHSLSLEELIEKGKQGMLCAAKKYDEKRGFKFCGFAVWFIRQSILQALNIEDDRKDSKL